MMACGGQNHGVVEVSMRGSKRLTQAAQKIWEGYDGKMVGEASRRWKTYVTTSPAVMSALEEGE